MEDIVAIATTTDRVAVAAGDGSVWVSEFDGPWLEVLRDTALQDEQDDAVLRIEDILGDLGDPEADFESFAAALHDYNRRSGELFAAVQAGPYNGAAVTDLVANLLARGARGVGQSSWGPTVFAWFPDREQAEGFVRNWPARDTAPTITDLSSHATD